MIIAYYTKNSRYEKFAPGLIESVKDLGLDIYVREYEDRGSWQRNCAIMIEFVDHCLHKFEDNIIYVDIDARFYNPPEEITEDLATIIWPYHPFEYHRLQSYVLYAKYNSRVLNFIKYWAKIQESKPDKWEQRTLEEAIDTYTNKLSVKELDIPKYCRATKPRDPKNIILSCRSYVD